MFQLRPELTLTLSAAAFQLCRWLAGAPEPPPAPRTAADELLYYLAADALTRIELPLGDLASSALVRLALASRITRDTVARDRDRYRWHRTEAPPELSLDLDDAAWDRLLGADGCVIVEALQPDLARQWIAAERAKGAITDPTRLAAAGRMQAATLGAFLDRVEAMGRADLATFLVDAAAALVDRPATAWTDGIRADASSIGARAEASRAAGAFLSSLSRISGWRDRLATVPFFEDQEYGEAQLLLAKWEHLGQAGFRAAAQLAAQLDGVRDLGGRGESDV